MFNLTPVVKNLLIVNAVVYILAAFFNIDVISLMGLRNILSPDFSPHQIVTHMFAHAGLGHIFSNMFALLVFGPWLERIWGPKRFLILYAVCGLGASVLYSAINFGEMTLFANAISEYAQNPNPDQFIFLFDKYAAGYYDLSNNFIESFSRNGTDAQYMSESVKLLELLYQKQLSVPMVGASGAVFGILMAFAMMFPNVELMLLFPPIPVKAKYLVGFYALYEIYSIAQRAPDDNVAHFAHIGGMIFAFFLVRHWKKTYL